MLSYVGDHICKSLTPCFWPDSTTFDIAFYQSNHSTGTLHFIDNIQRHTVPVYNRDTWYTEGGGWMACESGMQGGR
jgi:hypothetical protein